MNSPKVTDQDRGMAALVARLAGHPSVQVGILSDVPKAAHSGEPTGATLLEVAAAHEFGTATIPQRSFLRATVDEKEDDIRRLQTVQAQRILKNEVTPEQAVEQIGQRVVGMIQQRISAGIAPDLSDETIARKGSSKPLIDTGQLRSSITYKVNRQRKLGL